MSFSASLTGDIDTTHYFNLATNYSMQKISFHSKKSKLTKQLSAFRLASLMLAAALVLIAYMTLTKGNQKNTAGLKCLFSAKILSEIEYGLRASASKAPNSSFYAKILPSENAMKDCVKMHNKNYVVRLTLSANAAKNLALNKMIRLEFRLSSRASLLNIKPTFNWKLIN